MLLRPCPRKRGEYGRSNILGLWFMYVVDLFPN